MKLINIAEEDFVNSPDINWLGLLINNTDLNKYVKVTEKN